MPIWSEGTWIDFLVNNRPIDSGDVSVIVKSNGMLGYDVYLDEVYIRVFDGLFNYPKRIYFPSGESKIINVEAGTTVYI